MNDFNTCVFECKTHKWLTTVKDKGCPYCTDDKPTGIKHDSEKVRMDLLSPIAMAEIAKVMTFGAKKYSANNWRGGIAWSRVLGAALRHLLSYLGGEDKDPETGLSHLSHCACCIMFLLEYEVTHKELDDRYKYNV